MKQELLELGFIEDSTNLNFLKYTGKGFSIFANTEQSYVYTEIDGGGDRDNAFYPYNGKEKLQGLINAHIEYFK